VLSAAADHEQVCLSFLDAFAHTSGHLVGNDGFFAFELRRSPGREWQV
jgi:hypothetical protein